MLRLSKMTDYSTVIMAYMARRPQDVYSAAGLAAAIGVAATTASKILKTLARGKLVQSVRGAKGGYMLARAPEQISIADVIDAMEGSFGLTECSIHDGLCAQESACPSRRNWQRLNQIVRGVLDGVTLADMSQASLPVATVRAASHARAANRTTA
ncbi:MAG: SUF system Fe-S cluster assembly regulator [Rhodocyclales bacterium GWA2_65_20]|nr:MAG: SUF system Fe-S cluster assembly regulator [Rhodocyclales bacterium GWA2_65_20]